MYFNQKYGDFGMRVQRNIGFSKAMNTIKISLYETGFADLDSEWKQQDVCSPYSRLYYVFSGKGYLRIHDMKQGKERIHELSPGNVYLIPNGFAYDYFCQDRLEKAYIHFNVLMENGLDLFSGCQEYYEMPMKQEDLDQVKQWMLGNEPKDFFSLQGEVYRAVASFINKAGLEPKLNRQYSYLVSKVFAVAPGLKQSVSVHEIAKMLNVSESTLTKHFKRETGMSIGDYREHLIMNKARQLLADGKLSIREIAEELGFADQFYFCKYFKHHQELTPSSYRRYYKS